jgi:hypothetical protein
MTDRANLRALAEAATGPFPWHSTLAGNICTNDRSWAIIDTGMMGWDPYGSDQLSDEQNEANAAYIEAAVNALPALLYDLAAAEEAGSLLIAERDSFATLLAAAEARVSALVEEDIAPCRVLCFSGGCGTCWAGGCDHHGRLTAALATHAAAEAYRARVAQEAVEAERERLREAIGWLIDFGVAGAMAPLVSRASVLALLSSPDAPEVTK